jgi:FHS family L-fucose permease-like MFS transporter
MKKNEHQTSKPSIPVVAKNLIIPFALITSLFALWGVANDLTNPMVSAFKKVMPELTNVQASLVQFAFYFGYFIMALPAALFIRKYNYKSGIIVGLILYAIGAFLFYPAAANEEYTYFLISLYVITCGLAFLETTSNPLSISAGTS